MRKMTFITVLKQACGGVHAPMHVLHRCVASHAVFSLTVANVDLIVHMNITELTGGHVQTG